MLNTFGYLVFFVIVSIIILAVILSLILVEDPNDKTRAIINPTVKAFFRYTYIIVSFFGCYYIFPMATTAIEFIAGIAINILFFVWLIVRGGWLNKAKV